MIEEARGDLLRDDADALVNTVNTVGVMGKGIALQFKRAYPAMFEAYQRVCREGGIEAGRMYVWETGALSGPRFVINFPTKAHWRAPSRIEYIVDGLEDLVQVVERLGIRSIAVPPLGAGNGGLDWTEVRPKIESAFAALPDVKVRLYVPQGAPPPEEMVDRRERKDLTPKRAALVDLLVGYTRTALGATPIEMQKLMYFLQESGEELSLRYMKHIYGPYADNLRHVLVELEGSYLTGYGDGSSKVVEADPIVPLEGASEAARVALEAYPDTRERIERVLELVQGFDSMYGMELLASVHWIATREVVDLRDIEAVTTAVRSWTPRKAGLFTERHIQIALEHLRAENWVAA